MARIRPLPQLFWVSGGAVALAIGIIGLFLPLVPTTPFVLVAAYCFSKGSPRWHNWIMTHRHFGPMIGDWHKNRVVRRKTKVMSTVVTILMIAWPTLLLNIPAAAKLIMIAGGSVALVILWLQKESEP